MSARRTRFAPFVFDRAREQLLRGERPIRLRPKTLALLRLFVDRPGVVVEREEIMRSVWPDAAVTDVVLNVCVAELRRALGDDRAHPRYVETVHRRGFRFIAAAEDELPATATDAASRPARPPDGVFVGRNRELDALSRRWSLASQGELQVALVTGGPGIGKSSLVERFLRDLSELPEPAAMIGRGQCLDLRALPEPFLPALEALGSLCNGPFGAEVTARLRASAPAVLLHLPIALDAAESAALQQRYGHRGPEAMLRDLARALVAASEAAPLILLLEDLHWGDGSTVDLIVALAESRAPARILLLGTMRPGDAILEGYPRRLLHLPLRAGARASELALDLLAPSEVGEYLRQWFGSDAIAGAIAGWLADWTDGNPLFVAAVVEHLVETGVVRWRDGAWDLGDAPLPTTAPASVARLLRDRMARLDPVERQALDVAGVCGVVVASQAIAAGCACSTEEAESVCQRLAETHLMLDDCGPLTWPDGSVAQSYRFRHALYRQIVESAIPAARLRALHARVGEGLERAYARTLPDVAVQLTRHFRAAGDDRRTHKYAKLAARRAAGRGGYREAIALLGIARDALASRAVAGDAREQDELRLLAELGPLLVSTRGLRDPETAEVLARTRDLASRAQDLALRVSTLSTLATVWRQRGAIEVAANASRELLEITADTGEPALRLAAHMIAGTTFFHASDFAVARTHFESCLAIGADGALEAEQVMAALSLAATRGHLAVLLWLTGHPRAARALAEESLRRVAHTRFSPVASMAHALAAWAFVLEHDYERVAAIVNADAIVASDPPLPLWTATTAVMRGWTWVHLGRVEAGLEEVESGYRAYLDALGEASAIDYQVLRAEAYLRAGRIDVAAAMIDEAQENLRIYKQGYFAPELYRVRGEMLATRGTPAAKRAARAAWREGFELARERGTHSCALRLALALQATPVSQRDEKDDRALLSDVLASLDASEESSDLGAARRLAGAASLALPG